MEHYFLFFQFSDFRIYECQNFRTLDHEAGASARGAPRSRRRGSRGRRPGGDHSTNRAISWNRPRFRAPPAAVAESSSDSKGQPSNDNASKTHFRILSMSELRQMRDKWVRNKDVGIQRHTAPILGSNFRPLLYEAKQSAIFLERICRAFPKQCGPRKLI